jgi:hypothetical protein
MAGSASKASAPASSPARRDRPSPRRSAD